MGEALAVIVGAGPVGRAVGAEFRRRGVSVRFVTRTGTGPEGFETRRAEASDGAALRAACEGATIVVNAVGVAYQRWAELLPPIQTAVLEAAGAHGAVAVFVDNLYSYDGSRMPLTEGTPQTPATRKGALRKQLEDQWKAAHRTGQVRAVAVQASDYFGPGATRADTSHLGSRFFPGFEAGRPVSFLGDPGQPHSMTYLPDFARALADVALSPDTWGRSWICPSVGPTTFRSLAEDLGRVAGKTVKVGTVPKAMLQVLGLFVPMMKEVVEMLYQFEKPFIVDSSAFEARFGWKATAQGEAVRATWEAHQAGT